MNWLNRLGRWRQDPERREAQQAFLDEIADNWQPATSRERRGALTARLTHTWERLLGGSPSLAAAALAGVPCVLGSALITAAPQPHHAAYESPSSTLPSLLLTLGLLGLVIEAGRAPRLVRLRRFTLLCALPIAVASWTGAPTLTSRYTADRIDHFGFLTLGVGMTVVTFAAIHGRRRRQLFRSGLVVAGVGSLFIACGDGPWAVMFWRDHDTTSAAGCLLSAFGAALIAFALIRSRPEVA
jgi:hypothetical protein